MEEENNLNSKDTQNTFLKGSAWMTFGSIAWELYILFRGMPGWGNMVILPMP
jgi:hypothetical protein